MKTTFIAITLLCAAVTAHAQVSGNAISTSTTTSTAGATNAGNAQSLTLQSYAPGSQTIRSTGNAVVSGFAGSFSGDYCGGTAGVAVGAPGFAISGGMPKIDESCVMLRTFERVEQAAAADPTNARELRGAALDILAEIDPKIRAIFEKRGLVARPDMTTTTNTTGEKVYAVAQP